MKLRGAVTAATLLAGMASAQSPVRSAAEDVADISTNVCFLLASGGLVWEPRDLAEEIRQVEAAGLTYGVPGGVLDRLGRAGQSLVNRATLASRTHGTSHVILAKDGTIPGCRVLLSTAGSEDASEAEDAAEAVTVALGARGWTRLDAFTDTIGPIERRLFIRLDANRNVYGLRLIFARDKAEGLRLFTTMERLPEIGGIPTARVPR